jgi:agmatinase
MTNTFSGIRTFMKTSNGISCCKPLSILGIPYDLGTSNRPGARLGPAAIRDASAMLCDGTNPYTGVRYTNIITNVQDLGDLEIDKVIPLSYIEKQLENIIPYTKIITMGGDHTITYPLLKEHFNRYGKMSLIHFDAHVDAWGEGKTPNHGNFLRLAIEDGLVEPSEIIQIGLRSSAPQEDKDWLTNQGVTKYSAIEIHRMMSNLSPMSSIELLAKNFKYPTYLTFDIDCLDASQAPGTGTPEVGGLFTWQIMHILSSLHENGIKIIGGDVVEVSPAYDHSQITALAAATIIWNMLSLLEVDNCLTNDYYIHDVLKAGKFKI